MDVGTLAHSKALQAHILNVVIWITKLLIAQGPHRIIRVIFKDLEWESTQLQNKVALELVVPRKTIETVRNLNGRSSILTKRRLH